MSDPGYGVKKKEAGKESERSLFRGNRFYLLMAKFLPFLQKKKKKIDSRRDSCKGNVMIFLFRKNIPLSNSLGDYLTEPQFEMLLIGLNRAFISTVSFHYIMIFCSCSLLL